MAKNKHMAKKIAYFISDLEYNEVSDPSALADLLEEFLDNERPEGKNEHEGGLKDKKKINS